MFHRRGRGYWVGIIPDLHARDTHVDTGSAHANTLGEYLAPDSQEFPTAQHRSRCGNPCLRYFTNLQFGFSLHPLLKADDAIALEETAAAGLSENLKKKLVEFFRNFSNKVLQHLNSEDN